MAFRGVPIELDRTRHLRYPMSAVRKIEERFKVSLTEGETLARVSMDDAMWLVMLGLEHEQPPEPKWWERVLASVGLRRLDEPLTQGALEEMIGLNDMDRISKALQEAMGGAQGNDLGGS